MSPIFKNIAIVCNPVAGSGRATLVSEKIAIRLDNDQITYKLFQSNWPSDFESFTDVWIVGGDGTLNYFVNKYKDIRLPLVIFKGGSGNDFHWLLYGKKNLKEQIEIALSKEPGPIDAGVCNNKLFINGVGIGFDGAVAKALSGKKKLAGKSSYFYAIIKNILFYAEQIYSLQSDELNIKSRLMLISVANGKRYGGGFYVAPNAIVDDGWLDVNLVHALKPLLRLRYMPVIEKGRHLNLSFNQHYKTKKIIIESDELIQAHLDGEYYTNKKLEIEILPGNFLFRY